MMNSTDELIEAIATALQTADRDEAGLLDYVARDAQAVAEVMIEAGWVRLAGED